MRNEPQHMNRISIFLVHFFLPASLLISLITYAVYSHEVRTDRRIDETLEAESVSLNKNIISGELSSVMSDLVVLSHNSHLKEMLDQLNSRDKLSLTEDFIIFSSAKKMYDQIRFLDENGMEIIRVNDGPEGPYAVSEDELQLKKNRYYFRDTFELGQGEVFVSPLDLNIEKGVVETPLKPMIRFGTPVFNDEGRKKGVIILNYYGQRLLDKITALNHNFSGENLLVNSAGYYLKGENSADEWGFMYPERNKKRFDITHPEAWDMIRQKDSGQFYSKGYLFTFLTHYPIPSAFRSSSGSGQAYAPSTFKISGDVYHWKIISQVHPDFFIKKKKNIIRNLMYLIFPVMLIMAVGAWFLSLYKIKRLNAEHALLKAKEDLEIRVAQRTDDLNQLNRDLNDRVNELDHARDILQKSDRYYRSLINHIQEDIVVIAPDYIITDINDTFLTRSGFSRDQVIGRHCYDVCHGKPQPCVIETVPCPIQNVFQAGVPEGAVHKHTGPKGEQAWVEIVFSPLRDATGKVTHVIKVSRDISEERNLENQLRQSQKMEAIGRLAGGIAHDFNNILFPIMGYTEMALDDISNEDVELRHNLEEVLSGVLRARDLVTQILAFSYQTEQELRPLKISVVVKEALKLLKASIPSTIEIKTDIAANSGSVVCDATQIHQVVMNLCTNAYHAMDGNPGVIQVTMKSVEITDNDSLGDDFAPGNYVLIMVSDTGKSIDKEHIDRIFEPYFTTKEKGKGTGLGLSVVHGIVKSYGGKITVHSQKGEGTVFSIYLPKVDDSVEAFERDEIKYIPRSTRGEHLMIVDDDPTILAMEKKLLVRLGYRVSCYTQSIQALESFRKEPASYDLIITDFTMPNMTGEMFARGVMNIRKDMPLILLTGFSGKINEHNASKLGIKAYIMKPVILHELAQTVRNVLDAPGGHEDFSTTEQNRNVHVVRSSGGALPPDDVTANE